ncbi:MAG: DUF342 domain-containing protein [Thermotogae bacterium]|nr:DUF342 domain-containing protein [Thermotogota bacterium]
MRRIEVTVDEDKMNAFITLNIDPSETVSYEEVMNALKVAGIKFGILDDKIREMVENPTPGEVYLVAQGRPPVNGRDAILDIRFLHAEKPHPTQKSDGKVDMREMGKIKIVKKGQLLAVKIPPTPGREGINVFGERVPPVPGKDIELKAGKNTEVIDGGTKIIATADGIPKYVNGTFEVDEVLMINGDIDYSTGNIDFPGSVIVKGGVKPGFILKARENVEIHDIVEAATVLAGGNIRVTGVKGRGKGLIEAGRDVHAKFIENAEINARNDVIIERSVINSTIKAGRDVIVLGKPGEIVGGTISATRRIIANVIGSPLSVKTRVEVGIDPALREKHNVLNAQLLIDQENIRKLNEIFRSLESLKEKLGGTLPNDKMKIYIRVIETLKTLEKRVETLKAELSEIKRRINELSVSSMIVVKKSLFPGVEILIRDRKFYTEREFNSVILKLIKDEIKVGNYKEI